jgi:hypothetical protein
VKLTNTDRLIVVGLTGSGKTYWTNKHIVSEHDSVACWDPHRNYDVAYYRPDVRPEMTRKWGVNHPMGSFKRYREAFERFCQDAMDARTQVIIIEEVVLLMLRGCNAEGALVTLATQARHYGCAVVYVSQRWYNIPVSVRSQCSRVVSFQQTDIHDIDSIAAATTESKPKLRAKLPNLKRGDYFTSLIRSV